MESPTATDTDMTLNASRTVIKEDETQVPEVGSATRSSSDATNRAAAPQVVATLDWKKWLPWILGFLVLLLIVWLFSRKRGAGGGGPSA